MDKNKKKKILLIILIILLLLLIVFGAILLRNYRSAAKGQKLIDDLLKEALEYTEYTDDPQYTQEYTEDPKLTHQALEYPRPNMDKVTAVNPEIIGWIAIDGTRINYPILLSATDDSFYLSHNYQEEYDYQGSIFIESYNHGDFSDFNTIIYGHSMLNGNMFHDLHSFSYGNFLFEHNLIYIYTKENTLVYRVFECATIGSEHIFSYLDNNNPSSVQSFVNSLNGPLGGAIYDSSVKISPSDKIITLSTCTSNDNYRLTVYAKLQEVY